MNLREQANQASLVLDNEAFKLTIVRLNNDLVTQWGMSQTVEERETCWMKLQALGSIVDDLKAVTDDYKIENTER
jgi:hypothetical protein|tara:strand:+ start:2412 stop:2636 length:225 start_codon:yes stop_codon:yes gene_type:complete